MRKALILAVGLLMISAVPASAIVGFCARMPCCFTDGESHGVELTTEHPDCCDTISCAETPPQDLVFSGASKSLSGVPAVFPQPVAIVPSAPVLGVREYHDLAPPPLTARERLSVLSLLLI